MSDRMCAAEISLSAALIRGSANGESAWPEPVPHNKHPNSRGTTARPTRSASSVITHSLPFHASSQTLASSEALAPAKPDLTNVPEENKYKGCHYKIGVPEGGSCFTVLNAKPAWMWKKTRLMKAKSSPVRSVEWTSKSLP